MASPNPVGSDFNLPETGYTPSTQSSPQRPARNAQVLRDMSTLSGLPARGQSAGAHQQTSTSARPLGRQVQISTIENDRVDNVVKGLRAGITQFGQFGPGRELPRAARQSADFENWNSRLESADKVLEMIQKQINDGSISPGNAVRVTADGHTTGLMTVSIWPREEDAQDAFWIDNISTHPGAAGAGELLIEKAVELSRTKGFGGSVRLMVYSGLDFYESVGFEELGGGLMELRPDQSSKWSNVNDHWLLSRRMHKAGLVQDIPRTVPPAEAQHQAQLRQATVQARIEYALQLNQKQDLVPFAQEVMQGLQQAIAAHPQQPPMRVCEQTLRQWWLADNDQRPLFNKLIRAFVAG